MQEKRTSDCIAEKFESTSQKMNTLISPVGNLESSVDNNKNDTGNVSIKSEEIKLNDISKKGNDGNEKEQNNDVNGL